METVTEWLNQYGISIMCGITGIAFFIILAFWQQSRYKKMAQTHLKAIFWTEPGQRYRRILPIEPNGIEVRAPRGHTCPRYFFNKEAVFTTKYPESPFLGLPLLQVDMQTVDWPENCPEPINPYAAGKVISESLRSAVEDHDFLAEKQKSLMEVKQAQDEIKKAHKVIPDKRIVYIGLGLILLAVSFVAYLGWTNYQWLAG